MTIQFEFPSLKPVPEGITNWMAVERTLYTACENLRDLGASWEYPGFIQIITNDETTFNFGTVNGCYGYDNLSFMMGVVPTTTDTTDDTLPLTATLNQLTDWIRKVVQS